MGCDGYEEGIDEVYLRCGLRRVWSIGTGDLVGMKY